jgi:hypothetical protein
MTPAMTAGIKTWLGFVEDVVAMTDRREAARIGILLVR